MGSTTSTAPWAPTGRRRRRCGLTWRLAGRRAAIGARQAHGQPATDRQALPVALLAGVRALSAQSPRRCDGGVRG